MAKSIFITATGTDVGKTYVTALLVKTLRQNGFNAGYYKAALSGAEMIDGRLIPGDAKYVCNTAGLDRDPAELVSYLYRTPVAPHLAAKLDGNPLDMDVVRQDFARMAAQYDYVVMEGAGGIICPLRDDETAQIEQIDVIKALQLSVIIVADAGLGAINAGLLTLDYAKTQQIDVTGFILNRYETGNFLHIDNKAQLERRGGVPVIAGVAQNAAGLNISAGELVQYFKEV